jgi:hypothetical protein
LSRGLIDSGPGRPGRLIALRLASLRGSRATERQHHRQQQNRVT